MIKNGMLMVLATGFTFLASCKKDSTNTTTTPTGTAGLITCKVNGTAWKSLPYSNYYVSGTDTTFGSSATLKSGILNITGVQINGNDTSSILMVFVLTPNKTGTYKGTLDPTVYEGASFLPGKDPLTGKYVRPSGTTIALMAGAYTSNYSVTITKIDEVNKKVSGIFSITHVPSNPAMTTTYTVTEGAFEDVPLK